MLKITFNTLSALQTIHARGTNVFKGDSFYGVLDGGPHGAKSVQMVADNQQHAARRRIIDHGLPKRSQAFSWIDNVARLMILAIEDDAFADEGKGWSKPIDIALFTRWYSYDIISKVAYGGSLDMLRSEEYRWLPDSMERSSVFVYTICFESHVKFWRWVLGTNLPARLGLSDIVHFQRYTEFVTNLFNKRKATIVLEDGKTGDDADLFAHLIRANKFSDADLKADSSLLVAAGSDVVRLTVSAAMFYLLKNPVAMERVTDEICTSVASVDDISESTLGSMKYLHSCVDETLRITPPKASSVPREVGEGGITVDGVFVPKGMTVGVSVYSLHHDPSIFPEPYCFRPERWLEDDSGGKMRAAFCPLLKGPRMCPGGTITYFAVRLALFHLLYRYEVSFEPSQEDSSNLSGKSKLSKNFDEYMMMDWLIGFAWGPKIRLRRRA